LLPKSNRLFHFCQLSGICTKKIIDLILLMYIMKSFTDPLFR
jgi:hypothetical protein